MNIHSIITRTKSEGPGERVAIWVQGCSIHCDGCMAKDTWDTKPKQIMTSEDILSIIDGLPSVEGVTILGGEPFDQTHELAKLALGIKSRGLSLIVFSGHTYEELIARANNDISTILNNTDVLIDGPFIESQRSFERPLVGSDNQRFIFLTDRYSMINFGKNTIEIRISEDGIAQFNGMGDFKVVKERQVREHEF